MQAGRGIEAVREHERERQLYIDEGVLIVPVNVECQRSRARGRQNRTASCRIITIMLNRIAELLFFCTTMYNFCTFPTPITRQTARRGSCRIIHVQECL